MHTTTVSLVGTDTKLSATRGHPIYSEDRHTWIEAGKLESGEHLHAQNGTVEVETVTPRVGRHRVHNIEVESEHEYLASELGILGHNTTPCEPRRVAVSRNNHPELVKHNKQLASESGVAELQAGGGQVMAGAGHKTKIRDAPRLTAQYGGDEADWAKVTSSTHKIADGTTIEVHAYKNVKTGQVVEPKSKLGTWDMPNVRETVRAQ